MKEANLVTKIAKFRPNPMQKEGINVQAHEKQLEPTKNSVIWENIFQIVIS